MNSLPQKQLAIRISGVPSFAELLYFDEVTVIYRGFDSLDVTKRISKEKAATLDYLEANGVIRNSDHFLTSKEMKKVYEAEQFNAMKELIDLIEIEVFRAKQSQVDTKSLNLGDFITRLQNIARKLENSPERRRSKSVQELLSLRHQVDLRLSEPLRQVVSQHPEYEGTTIFRSSPDSSNALNLNSVFQITLNKFPIPAANTPLEKVLEFRSDRAAMDARRRLQRWMRKISEQNLKPRQIEDEIQELIEQYSEHMRLHRMKYRTSAFHGLFTASLSALENAVRFKFTDALNSFFVFRANQLALTEAEIKTPGRQVAYIVHAHAKFSQ